MVIFINCFSTTEEPTIIDGPEPFIVGLQDARTSPPTFTCMVGGAPEPPLLWTYVPGLNIGEGLQVGEVELVLEDGEDHNITYSTARESNGRFVVTSTLVFLSTTNSDGGVVRCKSEAASEEALLTVLGMHPVPELT